MHDYVFFISVPHWGHLCFGGFPTVTSRAIVVREPQFGQT
jgi:hypothetical protein